MPGEGQRLSRGSAGGVAGSIPFVGRERGLAGLAAAFEAASAGQLALVSVVGEPGIGKTALVEHSAAQATERSATIHWGRCWEDQDAPPLWPWTQLLRSVADGVAGAPDVQHLTESPEAAAPEAGRFSQFDAVGGFLAHASAAAPLVLVLDDLQWADVASLALLRFVAQDPRSRGMAVVAIYRDTEVDRPELNATLAVLARSRLTQIQLRGLTVDDTAELLRASLHDDADERVLAALHRDTNGNPFYVTQIIRLVQEEGGGTLRGDRLPIPHTVVEVIERRLARLPDGCGDLLEVAAAVGREFTLELMDAFERLGTVPVAELLDLLERAGFLTADPDQAARWTFTHDVLRAAVLSGIGAAGRADLHREVAEALTDLRAKGQPVDPEELMYHFRASGTGDGNRRASVYAREAAVRAQKLFAHEDAARQFALALALGDETQMTVDDQLTLRIEEAKERFLAGDHERGRSTALLAADFARESRDPYALARVAAVISRSGSRRSADRAAIALISDAIASLPEGDTPTRASLEAWLAMELRFVDPERARRLSDEALRRTREYADEQALLDALIARRYVVWNADGAEELLELGTEIIELAPRVGRPEMVSFGHLTRRLGAHELGDLPAMDAEMAAVADMAQHLRVPADHARVAAHEAMRAATDGRYGDGANLLERAASIAIRADDTQFAAQLVALRIFLARETFRFEEAFNLHSVLTAYVGDAPAAEAGVLGTMAVAGEAVPADRLRKLVDRLPERSENWLWLSQAAEASVCAHRIDDSTSAEMLLHRIEPYARRGQNVTCSPYVTFGAAAYFAGLCALITRDTDRAIELLRAAVHDNDRMRARPWLLRSLVAYAQALQARSSPDDLAAAAEALTWAAGLADELEPCVAVTEFRAAEPDLTGKAPRPGSLTERELSVLRLAAAGKTNETVARELALSVKTIERHLGNVYTKLGVRNRAEAAAWVVRQGLA